MAKGGRASKIVPPEAEPRSEAQGELATLSELQVQTLKDTPEVLRKKIIKLIETEDAYFALSGSDPREALSCCPVDNVGEANLLVEAGILEALRRPGLPGARQVSMYAFKNEIDHEGGGASFQKNEPLRQAALSILLNCKESLLFKFFRWVLLAFVLVSIGYGIFYQEHTQDKDLVAQLSLPAEEHILVAFFGSDQHCKFCDNIRTFSEETLREHFSEKLNQKRFVFKTINTDQSEFRWCKQEYEIFTATVVLIEFQNGKETRRMTLEKVWELFEDQSAFTAMLREELTKFAEGSP